VGKLREGLQVLNPGLATGQATAIDRHRADDEQIVREVKDLARLGFVDRVVHRRIVSVRRVERIEAGGAQRAKAMRRVGDRAVALPHALDHLRRAGIVVDWTHRSPAKAVKGLRD
jgi:hypothetical protein